MSTVICKYHPTVQAVDNCSRCHSAICVNDKRRLLRGRIVNIYCPQREQYLRKRDKKVSRTLIAIFGPILAIMLIYMFMVMQRGY